MANATSRPVDLKEEWANHLRSCARCRADFDVWAEKGIGLRDLQETEQISKLADRNDPAVLKKSVREGYALFRPDAKTPNTGLLVMLDAARPGVILYYRRAERSEFDAMA